MKLDREIRFILLMFGLAVGFSLVVPEVAGGILVLVAIAAYVLGLVLYVLSTWVSRRPSV